MTTKTVAEAERERTRRQYASLSSHYRSIGPAAVLAALMFTTKRTTKNKRQLRGSSTVHATNLGHVKAMLPNG